MLRSTEQRFEEKIERIPFAGCWLWTGAVNCERGYGYFLYDGRPQLAHRASWQMQNGVIPKGMNVLHRCDIPGCVNPDHLFLGTLKDNMADCSKKKRVWQQAKTHCPRGHLYAGDNITFNHGGKHRECRECKNWRNRMKYAEKMEAI